MDIPELGQAAPSFPPFILALAGATIRAPIDYFDYAIAGRQTRLHSGKS